MNLYKFLSFLLLVSVKFCSGQIFIDSCGLDTNSKLNKFEAEYFNNSITKQDGSFNFKNKIIAFTTGNHGQFSINKEEYFERWGREYYKQNKEFPNQLFILNEKEKEKSGGFDAIIISWSKVKLNDKCKQKIIDRLGKMNGS